MSICVLDRKEAILRGILPEERFDEKAGTSGENAGVAQSAEHLICNQAVAGSSPIASSAVGFDNLVVWRDSRVAKGSRL